MKHEPHDSTDPADGPPIPPELDLVHVVWGDDQGIVSLRRSSWLFYTWGTLSGHHANHDQGVFTVGIDDGDFQLLPADAMTNGSHDEACWDDVVRLLKHPGFRKTLLTQAAADLGGRSALASNHESRSRA